jgi:hypothetical protein
MCQPPLHLTENIRVGRIASKIMIELAGTVVVAGTGRQQIQAVRQRPQPSADIGIMILMVDFDSIQFMIMNESLQNLPWQHMLPTPTPGMGDHGEATRLVH